MGQLRKVRERIIANSSNGWRFAETPANVALRIAENLHCEKAAFAFETFQLEIAKETR
jgi:hypothetical protein